MRFSLYIYALVLLCTVVASRKSKKETYSTSRKQPNILLILADDLGYGDTNVPPFVGLQGIKTPGLERMATKSTLLTNYHTAAATCTPTRASILTGMYPWRIGIKAVFEYGKPGQPSNRNDWLPPLPTIPMVLREANYSVTHSGKWHLGGMRNDDLEMRILPVKAPGESGGRRCPHPGPNQQGFKNYVSVLDGPGSPRQNRLQLNSVLYSQGCTAFLHNDVDIGQGQYGINGFLSYCEAEHAIHAMNRSVARNKPFYIQVWFHAPHSPLEEIPGWHEKLTGIKRNNTSAPLDATGKYKTMVADMDHQIGRLLENVENLGIDNDTLIIFTSDNGPEPFAGSRAGFNGAKRYLYEGGIRVPAIVQWVGTIPAGQRSDMFAVSTDLFPTFLDAAGVRAPSHLRLDGLSLLPQLIPNYYETHGAAVLMKGEASHSTEAGSQGASSNVPSVAAGAVSSKLGVVASAVLPAPSLLAKHPVDEIKDDAELYRRAMRDRVTLWHNDYEGPRRTAAWIYDYKVMLNEIEVLSEMYDLQNDPAEKKNLIDTFRPASSKRGKPEMKDNFMVPVDIVLASTGTKVGANPTGTASITLDMVLNERNNTSVHKWIASHMYPVLRNYAKNGNRAHTMYLAANPGWTYAATSSSQVRADNLRAPGSQWKTDQKHWAATNSTCGRSPCSCEVKLAHQVPSLPFESTDPELTYLRPGMLLNGAQLLRL